MLCPSKQIKGTHIEVMIAPLLLWVIPSRRFLPAGAIQSPASLLSMRWIGLGALPLALLVGCGTQGLRVFTRTHEGAWLLTAQMLQRDLSELSIGGPGQGCLAFAAAGRHILSITDLCRYNSMPSYGLY